MKLAGDVVVTGACGAIGSNLVRRILKEPEVTRIICIDNLSAGHHWLLPSDPRVEFHDDDIEMEDVIGGVDPPQRPVVFHLAAHFANQRSVEEPQLDTWVNVGGTVNMLEWAKAWKSPLFVFASAGCAAGHEDTPYQISKTAGEAYCRYYYPEVPTAVFRFHNSYGPGEVPGPYRNVIPKWMWSVLNGWPITIFGDGYDRRDFVYVDDVVERLVQAEPSSKPQEIGTGRLTEIGDLARTIERVTGWPVTIEKGARRRWDHLGRPSVVEPRPFVALEDGIKRTWEWFRANEDIIRESIQQKGE